MRLQLALDYYRCEKIIQKHSASFYQAFSQVKDRQRRQGIFAIYAFCRYVDDLIDEKNDLQGLHQYKSELDDLVKGNKVRGFRWRALADTTKTFYQDEQAFSPLYEMIEGQEFDAHPVRIETVKQLIQYCDLVASSVGKMLLPILAPKATIHLTPFALALGRAFQLTNILRDIGEDYRRDRVYLPKSLMEQYGYRFEDLQKQIINPAFINLWEDLAKQAEAFYKEAETYLPSFPNDTKLPLYAALVIYRQLLTVIREAKYTVMITKHFVSDKEKLILFKQIRSVL